MTLIENFKVENGGIWISKEELQSWKAHYEIVKKEYETLDKKEMGNLHLDLYYKGKVDVLIDLLKTIEQKEAEV